MITVLIFILTKEEENEKNHFFYLIWFPILQYLDDCYHFPESNTYYTYTLLVFYG